ncbi:organic cation transporter protein-like [Pecten maximus]|uniref:organic cation transporter protein-like n=1 Tax=Pecten maximus TaxID=6579 RepID=UPI0014584115|nr:organic cation transporter protein-like [Pecten maximus]
MDFDKIVTRFGAFGRYQKWLYFLVCLASVFSGIFTVISAILLAAPDHRCKIPGYDNDTYAVQSEWHQDNITRYIPPSEDGTTPYDQCHIYLWGNSSHQENATKLICNEWNNLVCNNSYKTAFAKSLFFIGVLVGAITLGHISDAFGRKTSLLIGVILLTASTLSLAWSPGYTFFCVCMMFIGAASEGMCVITMSYYGLTLNTENLGDNFYLNFCLSGLVEFPAYTVPLLLMDRVGRKRLYIVCMAVGGAACVSTIFTVLYLEFDYQTVTVALAMLGKLGISAAFAIILVYSAELFPTVVRSAALSTCSIFGRIGGIVAPYVAASADLINGRFGRAFPMLVFGVLSLLAALSSLFLPETNGQKLPETIEDGILFGTPSYKMNADISCVDGPTGETCSENKGRTITLREY